MSRIGNWLTIKPPVFTDASGASEGIPQEMTDLAVSPASGNEILVTNGESIMKSSNGGCSWYRVYPSRVGDNDPQLADAGLVGSIRSLQVPGSGKVFAIQGCPAACKEDLTGVGPAVLVSGDGGATWTRSAEGLPLIGEFQDLTVAPGGAVAYLLVTPRGDQFGLLPEAELYASEDGGKTWELRASPETVGNRGPDWSRFDPVVDPRNPRALWTGGAHLSRSTDGGRTWTRVLNDVAVNAVEVRRDESGALEILIAGANFVARSAGTARFTPLAGAPGGISALATEPRTGDIFGVSLKQTYLGSSGKWRVVSDYSRDGFVEEVEASSTPRPAFFIIAKSRDADPAGVIDVFLPDGTPPPPLVSLNTIDGGRGCPPPPDPAPWQEGWDPVPDGSGPVYVTDFYTGSVLRFNDYGTGTVVAMAPRYTEGTALDPLGRLIATTRFSSTLTRLDPLTCTLVAIDENLPTNEGATFDAHGNVFVVDTNGARIFEYPWPQFPGQKPRLVYDMNAHTGTEGSFLEDARIAPPGSPFAGDIFVLYANATEKFAGDTLKLPTVGIPDTIARLTLTEDGWVRQRDFFELRSHQAGFGAIGMAFQPSGHLLVPDFNGSGEILRITPDGLASTVFAVVEPKTDSDEPGAESLSKIDVDAQGYVYLTVTAGQCAGKVTGDGTRLVRFAPNGTRLVPDFTHNSRGRCFVGVSVPHEFDFTPTIPPVSDPPIDEELFLPKGVDEPNRFLGALPPPLPPPLVPPLPPLTVPGVASAPAPAQAPAQSAASQAQAAAVPQRQEQPQLALVHAARQLRENFAMQNAMVRISSTRDPLGAVKVGLAAGALSLAMLWGIALSLRSSRRVVEVWDRGTRSRPGGSGGRR